jgi:hypothetical protein
MAAALLAELEAGRREGRRGRVPIGSTGAAHGQARGRGAGTGVPAAAVVRGAGATSSFWRH